MSRHRAPAEDDGLLIDPSVERMGEQLEANARKFDTSLIQLAGIPLGEFRRRAMAEVAESARRYMSAAGEPVPKAFGPLIIAGHQPEFFHPGVWVKNFVLNEVAKRNSRTSLNLVVDNDLVKSSAIRVPIASHDPEQVDAIMLLYDEHKGDQPYEEYRVGDREMFDSFPERLAKVAKDWSWQPLARTAWPEIRTHLDRGATFAEAVSRTRREIEREWGIVNLELTVSRLAQTRAFALFVHSILADLPRFVDCYNAAIRAYRVANKLRSRNHPAPELVDRNGSLEAPLWAWRADATHRQRLFARRVNGELAVLIQGREVERLPRDPSAFAERWQGLVGNGWKIRPRALMLTLFARMALGDSFIHGIGGAKYDEVTDEIIRRYFDIGPPTFAVVSATLRLPLPRFSATVDHVRSIRREIRDLEWKPEKHPTTQARFPQLVERKRELIASEPTEHAARRAWFRSLQDVTRAMRPAVQEAIVRNSRNELLTRRIIEANATLMSRESAWPLFPENLIQSLVERIMEMSHRRDACAR